MAEKINARVLEAVLVQMEDFAQFEFFNSYVLFLGTQSTYALLDKNITDGEGGQIE